MVIGLVHLRLRIPESQSLKGKRRILLGLKTRLRQKFNLSVSETDHQDQWQMSALSMACVGNDRVAIDRCLNQAVEMSQRERGVEILDVQMEFL